MAESLALIRETNETLSFDECNIHMENLKELYEIFLLIYEESN